MRNILGQPTHDLWAVKIRSAALEVGVTPTLIKSGTTPLELRKGFVIHNYSWSDIYIGDENVSSTSGMILLPWWTYVIDAGAGCNWYAIASAPSEARVVEGY